MLFEPQCSSKYLYLRSAQEQQMYVCLERHENEQMITELGGGKKNFRMSQIWHILIINPPRNNFL